MKYSQFPCDLIDLSKEEKDQLEAIMRDGNSRLKYWHEIVKSQNKLGKKFSRLKLSGDLIRHFNNKCHNGPLTYLATTNSQPVEIPHEDLVKIKAVRDAQPKILAGYAKIVANIINKWVKKGSDVLVSPADLLAEGINILLNCSYYFTDEGRFTTFVYSSVKRRIVLLCTRTSPLSEKTEYAAKLLRQYRKTKINFNGPCNFDEICDKMNLNQEDRVLLERMQVGVIGEITREDSYSKRDKASSDYSERAVSFSGYTVVARQSGVGNIIKNNNFESSLNYEQIIESAALNEFEQDVLKAWLEATDDRWRANFAETYVSPISFKKVTRQRVAQVAKDVERKIRQAAQKQLIA